MRLAEKGFAARLLRTAGIDPFQFSLLLDLFSKLSDRNEFEIGNARISLRVVVGIYSVFSGLFNLLAGLSGRPSLRTYVFVNFAVTLFLLLMILATEAINTFINPVEASVLAHQPLRPGTYFAAKLTYLAGIVGLVVFPLSAVPSLAGLNLKGARWFYPVTYLISIYLLGFLVALMACAVLGFLFRVLPVSRIRSAVQWLHAGFLIVLFIGPRVARFVIVAGQSLSSVYLAAIPITWFVALALAGHSDAPRVFSWVALVSMISSAVFVVFGIRFLLEGYLTRAHLLLRSGSGRRVSWRGSRGVLSSIPIGRPSGRAAFAFMYRMMRTDWQFRRAIYPILVQVLILPVLGMTRGLGASPFTPATLTGLHFLPHIPGLISLAVCSMVMHSDQYRAAWIFLTVPLDGIRSFVRGIFWALWMPLSIVPVVLMPLLAWRWGIADALLFAAYSIALGSFYLSLALFLTDGLPFANPPKGGKASMAAPLVLGALIAAGVLVALQWLFIFRSRIVTAGTTFALGAGAYAVAQTSLRYLEVNVMHNLHTIASGRRGMFKDLDQ